jgi:pimeloyl-ACP methyl ester carboxylesterase
MTHVIILVPGIMGSVLQLGEEVIWPGPLTSLLLPFANMGKLLSEDLVATKCIGRYFLSEQYDAIISYLEHWGFSEAKKTLLTAPYDWRKSNESSAEVLARCVENAFTLHGGDVETSIIAHSMGGLIARYYLESGGFESRRGFGQIRRLITMGTPHRGAAIALPRVLGMEKVLFLSANQVLQIASDPRYPAAYQLLPPRGEPFAWDRTKANAQFATLDIYGKLGLVRKNLDAAEAFYRCLDHTRRPKTVRYFCFCGTRQITAPYVYLNAGSPRRWTATKFDVEAAGDGTVPIWSSTLPGCQFMYVGGEHGTIYKNDDVRGTLAALLGYPEYLAAQVIAEVSLREKVVEPNDLVRVALTVKGVKTPDGVNTLDGELLVCKAPPPKADGPPDAAVGDLAKVGGYPVRYQGLRVETIGLAFPAPVMPGYYQVAFRSGNEAQPCCSDWLIVQSRR